MPDKLIRVEGSFDVYLERNRTGLTMANVPQLPGCIVRASTSDLVIQNIDAAIRQYLFWLATHTNSQLGPFSFNQINIADQCLGDAASGSGSRVALLMADLMPLSKTKLEEYLLLMIFSRTDLLEIVTTIPEDVLDFCLAKLQRSHREIPQHVAGAEQWYLTGLTSIPRIELQSMLFKQLELERETAYACLLQQDNY